MKPSLTEARQDSHRVRPITKFPKYGDNLYVTSYGSGEWMEVVPWFDYEYQGIKVDPEKREARIKRDELYSANLIGLKRKDGTFTGCIAYFPREGTYNINLYESIDALP